MRNDRPTSGDAAAGILGGEGDRFHARDVAGETGDGDAAAQIADQGGEAAAHVEFAAGVAFDHGVGRVADDGEDAFFAECRQRGLIGGRTEQGDGVEFPVAGVEDGAGGGVDDKCLRLGDRVGQADEAQRERLQVDAAARRDDVDADLVVQAVFAQLAAQDRGGERGAVDRAFEFRPEPCDGADVILMRVGDDEAEELVFTVGDEARVCHHDLDLGEFAATEADAAVNGEPFFAGSLRAIGRG